MGANRKYNKNRKKKKNKKVTDSNNDEHVETQQDLVEDEEHLNLSNDKPPKRQHDQDDDSDQETEKPRKKKKKQPTGETDKKGQKSIRQMKREKHAQRQAEAQAAAKDQHKGESVTYLSQWKHDRQNWKFMKAKQAWLYKNKFSSYLVPDSSWPILLEYFQSAQGNIRNLLLSDAHNIIKQMDDWTESQETENQKNNEEDEENQDSADNSMLNKPDENVYKRARDLIQCLEE